MGWHAVRAIPFFTESKPITMKNYITIQREVRQYWNHSNFWEEDSLLKYFVICCANWRRFRPDISWEQMPRVFRQMNINIWLAAVDQNHPDVWTANTCKGCNEEWLQSVRTRPGIIATFHTGSYRLLPRLLAREGIPFSLLLARKISAEQGDFIQSHNATLHGGENIPLIDAQEPSALFTMRKALGAGRNLVAYIDGNIGIGELTSSAHASKVSFFESHLIARSGLCHLSVLGDYPIYPVLSTRNSSNEIRFCAYPPIVAHAEWTRHDNVKMMMKALYGHLEDALRDCPEGWEGWGYFHHKPDNSREKYRWLQGGLWPQTHCLPWKVDRNYYALDTLAWHAYPIRRQRYDLLYERLMRRTHILA